MAFTIIAGDGFMGDTIINQRYGGGGNQYISIGEDSAIARRPNSKYLVMPTSNTTFSYQIPLGYTAQTMAQIMEGKRTLHLLAGIRGNLNTAGNALAGFGLAGDSALIGGLCIRGNLNTPKALEVIGGTSVQLTIPYSAIPTVTTENIWRQLEIRFVNEVLGGLTGTVEVYINELLVGAGPINLTSTQLLRFCFQKVSNNRFFASHFSDVLCATGDDPTKRMGETYIEYLPAVFDEQTTGWVSSSGSEELATDVTKESSLVTDPFIETSQLNAPVTFSSNVSFPTTDGREIIAVAVSGAGQSNSTSTQVQHILNDQEIEAPVPLALGVQTITKDPTAPLGWQNVDPADGQPWTPQKVNNLTFGIVRKV